MKLLLGILVFAGLLKGAMWLGDYMAKKNDDDDIMNNDQDQSHNMFV